MNTAQATCTTKTLDLADYKRQGNLAIDMVAECIIHYRRLGMNPKAVILNPAYYGVLQQWVEKEYGGAVVDQDFALDGVEIRRERIISGKILNVEVYPKPKAEA